MRITFSSLLPSHNCDIFGRFPRSKIKFLMRSLPPHVRDPAITSLAAAQSSPQERSRKFSIARGDFKWPVDTLTAEWLMRRTHRVRRMNSVVAIVTVTIVIPAHNYLPVAVSYSLLPDRVGLFCIFSRSRARTLGFGRSRGAEITRVSA